MASSGQPARYLQANNEPDIRQAQQGDIQSGPEARISVWGSWPDIRHKKTARYPTQKRDQISVNCTQADIRQLHAGRYPSGTHRQISVNCTQADIRQLHTARYPSAAHSQISVSCTQPDIWERDGDRYLALRADQIPPDTNQISGSCGDDPTQWRPQISGICATGYLAWARRKDEDFFDQPDIWWYANQRRSCRRRTCFSSVATLLGQVCDFFRIRGESES